MTYRYIHIPSLSSLSSLVSLVLVVLLTVGATSPSLPDGEVPLGGGGALTCRFFPWLWWCQV